MSNDLQIMLSHGPEYYANKVRKLCDRLFTSLSLTAFSWTRIHQNGLTYTLCSNPKHYESYYLDGHFIKDPCVHSIDSALDPINIWGTILNHNSAEQMQVYNRQVKSNMFNGICLQRSGVDYYETFDFATDIKDRRIINKFVSNIHKLNQFSDMITLNCMPYLKKNHAYFINLNNHIDNFKLSNNSSDFLPAFNSPNVNINLQNIITAREKEVLYFVMQCCTDREIGELLHISPRTVEKHVNSLKNKLDCRRRADIIRLFAG
ncbi:MAG: helix-turn-helix transcriptional regulator [Gammaproteobacteria bacterium]|nr:helix-turn-helix transcriptional regulator [Gammaproteobacteria bacterium]